MKIQKFDISGPLLILPMQYSDERGFFSETFRKDFLEREIGSIDFVQDNHSYSSKTATVRGLHFQVTPNPQAKLVRVVRGGVMDVAVDIRTSSTTYGKHIKAVLSAENFCQLFVPIGFAHGFCTLEPDTEVIYKVSSYYDPATEKGLLWNDPALGIDWPIKANDAILTDKDRNYPHLIELGHWFD